MKKILIAGLVLVSACEQNPVEPVSTPPAVVMTPEQVCVSKGGTWLPRIRSVVKIDSLGTTPSKTLDSLMKTS